MKKQYVVSKFVMANSVKEALEKSKKIPVSEIYVHNSWFERVAGFEFTSPSPGQMGFKKPVNKP